MRIIAGKFKKRTLRGVPGSTARPTTDYWKETIFNTISDCEGLDFLDLYSGSGSVALEAISRGARSAVMVEFAQRSISTIISNIEILECKDQCRLIRKKVIPFIKKCEQQFDLIFLDPPYNKKLLNSTLEEIYNSNILRDKSIIIAEHSPQEPLDDKWSDHVIQIKKTRQSQVSFLSKTSNKL